MDAKVQIEMAQKGKVFEVSADGYHITRCTSQKDAETVVGMLKGLKTYSSNRLFRMVMQKVLNKEIVAPQTPESKPKAKSAKAKQAKK